MSQLCRSLFFAHAKKSGNAEDPSVGVKASASEENGDDRDQNDSDSILPEEANANAEEKEPSLDLMHVINRWAEEELCRQAEAADAVPRSPKPEEGIPFEKNVPSILKTQAILILRMAKTLGLAEQDFNRFVLQAIFRLAAYIELLPASKQHHHREAGGLFRHSLEVAFEASQMSKGVVFSRIGSTEEIDAAKTRWSLACFLVGLCHDVGKIEANIEVYDRVTGRRWNPFTMSLWRWGMKYKVKEYHVRWKPGVPHSEHELLNAQLARAIIPDAALDYLHEIGSEDIVQLVMKALSGFAAGNKIHEVVTAADMKSVRLYNLSHGYTGKAEGEARLDERFCTALRHRIQLGEFATNVPGGQFWFIEGRCFLVWTSDVVESIRAALQSLNLASIPNDLNVLAGALVDDGLLVPHEIERKGQFFRSYLWYILPKGVPKPLRAVLLKTSRVIMRMPPDNVDGKIVANPTDEYDVPVLSEDERRKPAHAGQESREPKAAPSVESTGETSGQAAGQSSATENKVADANGECTSRNEAASETPANQTEQTKRNECRAGKVTVKDDAAAKSSALSAAARISKIESGNGGCVPPDLTSKSTASQPEPQVCKTVLQKDTGPNATKASKPEQKKERKENENPGVSVQVPVPGKISGPGKAAGVKNGVAVEHGFAQASRNCLPSSNNNALKTSASKRNVVIHVQSSPQNAARDEHCTSAARSSHSATISEIQEACESSGGTGTAASGVTDTTGKAEKTERTERTERTDRTRIAGMFDADHSCQSETSVQEEHEQRSLSGDDAAVAPATVEDAEVSVPEPAAGSESNSTDVELSSSSSSTSSSFPASTPGSTAPGECWTSNIDTASSEGPLAWSDFYVFRALGRLQSAGAADFAAVEKDEIRNTLQKLASAVPYAIDSRPEDCSTPVTRRLIKHAPSLLPVLDTFGKLRRVSGMLPSADQDSYELIPLWVALAWQASGFFVPSSVVVEDDRVLITNLRGFCKLGGIRVERLLERLFARFRDKADVADPVVQIRDRLTVLEVRLLSGTVAPNCREAAAKEVFLLLNPTEEDFAGFVHPSLARDGSVLSSGGRTRGISRVDTVLTPQDQVGAPVDSPAEPSGSSETSSVAAPGSSSDSRTASKSKKDKSAGKTRENGRSGRSGEPVGGEPVSYVDKVLSDLATQLVRGNGPWIDGVKRHAYEDCVEIDSYVFKRVADLLKNPNLSWQLRNRVSSGDVARMRMAYDRESGKTRVLIWQRNDRR